MKIEITERGSEAFYTETVNVMSQFRALLKTPDRKLRDNFRMMRPYLILCAVLLVLILLANIFWGFDALGIAAMIMLAAVLLVYGASLMNMNKMRKGLESEFKPSTLTLDESGAELERPGVQTVKLGWSSIAFVRAFSECVCIVPASTSGIMISVDAKYASEIFSWLGENQPQVRTIR